MYITRCAARETFGNQAGHNAQPLDSDLRRRAQARQLSSDVVAVSQAPSPESKYEGFTLIRDFPYKGFPLIRDFPVQGISAYKDFPFKGISHYGDSPGATVAGVSGVADQTGQCGRLTGRSNPTWKNNYNYGYQMIYYTVY